MEEKKPVEVLMLSKFGLNTKGKIGHDPLNLEKCWLVRVPLMTRTVPRTQAFPKLSSDLPVIQFIRNGRAYRALVDMGAQSNIITWACTDVMNAKINPDHIVSMRGVSMAVNDSLGCVEDLNIDISPITCCIHAHIFERAPYDILLGQPFLQDHCHTMINDECSDCMLLADWEELIRRVLVLLCEAFEGEVDS
jgi:hypothetical protein